MGVAFTQATSEQRYHVEKFIHSLMSAGDVLPELLVEPEGLENAAAESRRAATPPEVEDPLLELFEQKASLPAELFMNELRKQRTSHHSDPAEESILPV
jgi:hypothetical protein